MLARCYKYPLSAPFENGWLNIFGPASVGQTKTRKIKTTKKTAGAAIEVMRAHTDELTSTQAVASGHTFTQTYTRTHTH